MLNKGCSSSQKKSGIDLMVIMVVMGTLLLSSIIVTSSSPIKDETMMNYLKIDSELNIKELQRAISTRNDDVCDDCDDDDGGGSTQNQVPVAFIYEIIPNPSDEYDRVSFTGYGEDSDGTVISYLWNSDIDGELSEHAMFNTTTLSPGIHNITFKVRDNSNSWSDPTNIFLEVRENQAPFPPVIGGSQKGKTGESIEFSFITTDPNSHRVSYFIQWGDGTNEEWTTFSESDEEITLSHTWESRGSYEIQAKAKDEYDAESEWATMEVSMPKSGRVNNFFFFKIMQLLSEDFESFAQLINLIS